MGYQSQREKVKEFIENQILKQIDLKELDYVKLISTTSSELGVSHNMVKEMYEQFFQNGKLKCVVTLPDKEIADLFKKKKEDIENDFKEAGI